MRSNGEQQPVGEPRRLANHIEVAIGHRIE
jgi:hypothetical protein